MTVYVTLPTRWAPEPWHEDVFGLFRAWLAADGTSPHGLVEDPDEADVVLFMELTMRQDAAYVEALLDEPLRRAHTDRLVTYNVHWRPAGFLPGLYTGLTPDVFDPVRHVPWGFLFLANGGVHRVDVPPPRAEWLFSFWGASSHPLRERILSLPVPAGMKASLVRVDRWFDHSREEQTTYVEALRRSAFVLCPRGVGPSSHRLFETMAVGRCPVIVSDEWVPVVGIDWSRCAIRVPEADIPSIPALLESRADEAEALGARAREEWERCFSKATGPRALVDRCRGLIESRPAGWDERNAVRSWLDPDRLARLKGDVDPNTLLRLERKIDDG